MTQQRTSEANVEHLGRAGNEAPAAAAHSFVRAARTDLVVVSHINVEDELAPDRL